MLTSLKVGVSIRPVENGQLHQLHLLQIVLSFRLEKTETKPTDQFTLTCLLLILTTVSRAHNHLSSKTN